MNEALSPRRHTGLAAAAPSRHGRPGRLLIAVLLVCASLSAGFLVAGCDGDSPGPDTTAVTAIADAVSTTVEAPKTSASELADTVIATWVECMQKLSVILEDRAPVSLVQPQVEQLKEEYIQKFVELGRQRETLSQAEKDDANSQEWLALSSSAEEPWYLSYQSLYDFYAAKDVEFANLLGGFHILTQYSDFELLKKQEPEEAARLGVG
jgi:hypothetical protein